MAEVLDVGIPLIHRSDIVLEEVPIGRGGFGTVYRGKHKLFGLVAVKTLIDNGLLPQKHTKALQQEAKKLLEICHHPNILNIYGVIMEKDNYSLILEYMPLGSLSEFRKEFTVRWPLMVQILKEVVSGMDFLHQKKPPVYHLDLKADNVLLEGQLHAKLCDFGLSEWKTVTVNVNRNMDKSGRRCTTSHLPPEVWANVNRAPDSYYDVYSFGIVIWEMLSGAVPFGSQSDDIIRSAVLTGQRPDFTLFPKDTPQALSDMMTRCWHQKPKQRPAFSALKTEVDKLFTEKYERHLIPSLKALRQDIILNYDASDPVRTSTAVIDTLQEPELEPEPEPEPQSETIADPTAAQQETPGSPVSQPTQESAPIEVKPYKLDKDLEPFERQIRRILRDPVGMRLAKTSYIRDIFNISEATQNILNDSVQLNRIIESDAELKWELYFAKTNVKTNLSGVHFEMAQHSAKTYLEINQDDIERVFRSSSYSSSYGGYGYHYGSTSSERSEREKRRDRVDTCIRKHPHLKDMMSGDRFYRLKKALENPQHLEQAVKEKLGRADAPRGISSLKLTTIDPEVIDIAKDPLLLLTILKDKDDILRNLYSNYPDLLCQLVANAKRKYSLPSGGFIDPPRKHPRDLFPPSLERDMMMGMIDPEEIMMMREMEMRHRMRRNPDDSDSDDDDDYPSMMGMRRRMRMMREMRDMRPSRMEAMMRHMARPSMAMSMSARAAMMEPDLAMESSSSGPGSRKEHKEKQGIMKRMKNFFGGKNDSGKKKDESDYSSKMPDSRPNIPSVARSSSGSSSSSSNSSAMNIVVPDASVPLIDASVPNTASRISASSSASTAPKAGASSPGKPSTTTAAVTSTTTSASSTSTTSASTTSASATSTTSSVSSSTTASTATVSSSTTVSTAAVSAKPTASVAPSKPSADESVTKTKTAESSNISAVSNTSSTTPVSNTAPKTGDTSTVPKAADKSTVKTADKKTVDVPTVPKTLDESDIEMTVPKSIDDDLETDTQPSMAEPMEVDLSHSRPRPPVASTSSSNPRSHPVTPSASGSQQQTPRQPQVRSRPKSDNTTPPPSEPKKIRSTIDTDAQPSLEASAAQPESLTIKSQKGASQMIEHHHGDGAKTYMKWDEKATKPNIQIGHSNLMVVGDDLNDDPWSSGPMPQREKQKKRKEIPLTKSTRIVTPDEMDEVAVSLGKDFKKLRRYLNMPDAIVEQIELDYHREGQHEVTYQMLRKWKEMRGSMATIAALAEALHKISRDDVAQRLK